MSDNELTRIHDAQVAAIHEALPVLRMVEEYAPQKLGGDTTITSPAVLLEAVQIKPGRKVSGSYFAVTIEFAAHCILSMKTTNVQLEIRNLATRLMQIVYRNRWGLDYAEMPEELSAFPGSFSEEIGFESWVVSWEQSFQLGSDLSLPDFLPDELYYSESPRIGAAHKDDYRRGV